jgi:hypothetical protein
MLPSSSIAQYGTASLGSTSNSSQEHFRIMNQAMECAFVWRNCKKKLREKFEEFW